MYVPIDVDFLGLRTFSRWSLLFIYTPSPKFPFLNFTLDIKLSTSRSGFETDLDESVEIKCHLGNM
jgi:hypothetical protein